MNDRRKIILIEIAVILLFFSLSLSTRMYPDEGTYLNYGESWKSGKIAPSTEVPVLHRPVFVSIVSLVSGLSLILARFAVLPFIMGSVYVAYLIGKELGMPGEYTSLPLLLSPIYLSYFGTLLPDYTLLFFILLSIYLFLKSREAESYKWSYLMGISTALAILTKESTVLLVPVFLFFYREFEFKRFLAAALIPVVLYIVAVGQDFFLFLEYSLNYSYPIAPPSISSFLSMFMVGLGPILILLAAGTIDLDYDDFPVKFSAIYLLVTVTGTLLISSTWVERYVIFILPGLLVPSAMGLKKVKENKGLISILIISILLTGMFIYSHTLKAEEEWSKSKYESGLDTLSEHENGVVYMQMNDEQLRWLTGSNRFRKLPRRYEELKRDTDCKNVPVFLWKYGKATIWKPFYWYGDQVSKELIDETEEGKFFRVNCTA